MLKSIDLSDLALRKAIVDKVPLAIVGIWLVFQPFYFSQYTWQTKLLVLCYYFLATRLVLWGGLLSFASRSESRFAWIIGHKVRIRGFLLALILAIGTTIFLFKISFGYYPPSPIRIATGMTTVIGVWGLLLVLIRFQPQSKPDPQANPDTQSQAKPQALPESQLDLQAQFKPNPQPQLIHIHDLAIPKDELRYVESMKNYLQVVTCKNGELTSRKIRANMKDLPTQEAPKMFRCHRGFAISILHIQRIEKEGQNTFVYLHDIPTRIPVSRNKVAELKQRCSIHP